MFRPQVNRLFWTLSACSLSRICSWLIRGFCRWISWIRSWVVILRRHDREVLGLLIFCISEGLLATFIKNAVSCLALSAGGKTVDITVFYTAWHSIGCCWNHNYRCSDCSCFYGGAKKGKVRGAGVIMIGPIPIIFGTDKKSVKTVLALALALTIVVLIITVVYYWLLR